MRILLVGTSFTRPGRLYGLAGPLRRGGHVIDQVELARAGAAELAGPSVDLIVLELGAPMEPALALLRALRRRSALVPVVALAGNERTEDRIAALDAGADDCVAPTQSDEELVARLRVWHRRGLGSAANLITVGPLTFDARERVVFLDQQPLGLSRRELSLLEALIRRAGRYVDTRHLLEQLFAWNEEATLNSVQVYISRLRRKIRHQALRIETARGLGYCLDAVRGTAPASWRSCTTRQSTLPEALRGSVSTNSTARGTL